MRPKKKKKPQKKKTQKATKHTLTFPSFPAQKTSLFTPVYRFIFHVHKQKYIHSSHFGTVFFSFFLYTKNYKKLQKAPLNRPVVTLADPGVAR